MFYATFKNVGDSDITAFPTEQQRDDWVNFKDKFSTELGVTSENCTFGRMKLSSEEAEKRIKQMPLHRKDEFNKEQEWYSNF